MTQESLVFSEEMEAKALLMIDAHKEEAERLLGEPDKLEKHLKQLEDKLQEIPKVGNILAQVPLMISMIRAYVKKEYTDISPTYVIAVLAALLYVLSTFDLIPDFIPGAGYLDDALVIIVAGKIVELELENYSKWRAEHYGF